MSLCLFNPFVTPPFFKKIPFGFFERRDGQIKRDGKGSSVGSVMVAYCRRRPFSFYSLLFFFF
jgi:hypothetical protein